MIHGKTVGLAMIVRDAADTLPACLEAALPFIDAWTIIDTGSEDNTPDIAQDLLEHLPGKGLLFRQWQGFAHNRTELLREARGTADYLLLLDDDMVLHQTGEFPELTMDEYEARIQGSLDYALPVLLKGDKEWRYEGVAHSYLVAPDGQASLAVLDCLEIEDHSHTGVDKLRRDVELLSAEHARNPLDARTVFYLAQSYADLDMVDEAILYYRMRASMGGWDEEAYVARHRLGCLLGENVSFAEGAKELLVAWEQLPRRAESLRALANLADSVADKIPYPEGDRLFIRRGAYTDHRAQLSVLPQPEQTTGRKLTPKDVSAVLVTRGNVDMRPIIDTLPYEDIVIWDNSKRENLRTFGRYVAVWEAKNDVVYFQDDDVFFTEHDQLLASYQPGKVVANMDQSWIQACGYHDIVQMGAGSITDRGVPWQAIHRYLANWPHDDDFLTECDFVVGAGVPGVKIDVGYGVREFADDPDRLYQQPGQTERKWKVINRALLLRGAA